jgi:uncharacterized protein (TIGR02117 family)
VRRAAGAALALILLPVLLMTLWMAAGLAGALLPGPLAPLPPGPGVHRIGLAAGPIHYDILLPLTAPVRDRFAFAETAGVPVRYPQAEWLVVGWGAQGFYTSTRTLADMAAGTILQAATGDAAVLRLDALGPLPPDAPVTWLALSDAALVALAETIAAEAGSEALAHPGFTDTDAFWPAAGRFHLMRTCNVWVGERLRAAGLRLGAWTPTPQAVRLSLWWNGLAGG